MTLTPADQAMVEQVREALWALVRAARSAPDDHHPDLAVEVNHAAGKIGQAIVDAEAAERRRRGPGVCGGSP